MSKIFLDPGHGGSDPGASGFGLNEKDKNLNIALKVKSILEFHNIDVNISRSTDVYVSLSNRARLANNWGADLFLSIHCNSFNSVAYGLETFCFIGSTGDGKDLATKIQESIIDAGLYRKDRGVKEANFAVLRETYMPAALVEMAFIDNKEDNNLLVNKEDEFAIAIVKGILKKLGITYVPPTDSSSPTDSSTIIAPNNKYYKVSIGAYSNKTNADIQKEAAVKAGFSSAYISSTTTNGTILYRVLLGAFKQFDNAKKLLDEAKAKGFTNTYIFLQ